MFKKNKSRCIDCGKEIGRNHKRCRSCHYKYTRGKNHPSWISGYPKCIDCGKELKSRYAKRCRSCHNKFNIGENNPNYKKKIKLRCEICNKTFYRSSWQANRSKYHICGHKCIGRWNSKHFSGKNSHLWKDREKHKCLDCGKELEGYFAKRCKSCYSKSVRGENSPLWKEKPRCIDCGKQLKNWKAKKCRSCSNKAIDQSGERNHYWKGGKPKCIDCGKQLLTYGQKRCRLCHAKSVSGKNSPLWRDGASFKPYPLGWNRTFKEQIRYRDKYTCRLCGVPEVECSRRLSCHHIDYDKENLKENNLLSLCTSCHMKTNREREFWIEFFSKNTKINVGLKAITFKHN